MDETGCRKEFRFVITIFITTILIGFSFIIIFQNTDIVDGSQPEMFSSEISMDQDLVIDGDEDFEKYSHISGNGTENDPYLISDLDMNEYSIIVKNTTSFFMISNIDWDTSDNYRLVFMNNTHVILENLSISSELVFKGINSMDIRIISSFFSTDKLSESMLFKDFNHLFISNSAFNMTYDYNYGEIKYTSNNGSLEIDDSYLYKFNLITDVTGSQIIHNSTFMNSYLSPEKMSNMSMISDNYFYKGGLNLASSVYEYIYGLINNNSFHSCYKAVRIIGDDYLEKDRLIIKNNYFNHCDYGIHGWESSDCDVTGNFFNHSLVYGIYLIRSDGYKIWKNIFLKDGDSIQAGVNNEGTSYYDNDWNSVEVGNYWDHHLTPDMDGNGVVDKPCNISERNRDMIPVTNKNFDIDKPEIEFTSHSSGQVNRSYNRIKWETYDEFGIRRVEWNSSGSRVNVTGKDVISVFLEEGTHNLAIKCTDNNGLFNQNNLQLELERTYPVLIFTTLSDGYFLEYDPVPVQWDIVDYFPVAKQNFTIDGKKITLSTDTRSRNLDLNEGPHLVSVTLTDDLGLEITEKVEFTVDRKAPLIELSGPSSGSTISTRTVIFDCKIIETVGLDSAGYRLDNGEWIEVAGDFSFEKVLDYGDHEFYVEAVDGAGHTTVHEVSFQVSRGNLVEVLSPSNGTVFNTDTIDLEWTYGGKFIWSEAFLRVGTDSEFSSIGTSYESEMSFPKDGEYLITLKLVDEVGNYIQSNFRIIKDTKDPTVGFLDVDDINYINTWKMDLSWNAVDNNGIDHYELKIDERDWDHKGLETSSELGLTEGEHTISIRAFDLAGNIDEAEIEVIVDITPPELEFLDMDVFTSTGIEIEWECDDNYGIESMFITIEGLKQKDVLGKDSYSITLNQDGRYEVTLDATDLAGNLESISTVIVVDTTEPRAVWKGNPISIMNSTRITLEWEIDEDVGIKTMYLTVDGNRIDLDINDTSCTIDLEDGSHTISLTVIDIGGWQYILNYPKEVLIDTEDPTLQMVDKIVGKDGTASFSWTVTDVTQSDMKVMISLDGGDYIEVLGDSYKTDMLPPGDHTIKIKIIDKAGNEAEEIWSFTIEEEKDEVDGGSGGLIIIIVLIIVILIIIAGAVVLIIVRKKKKEAPEENPEPGVNVPSRPPGIGRQRIDNNMLAAPPVNRLQELPAANANQTSTDEENK